MHASSSTRPLPRVDALTPEQLRSLDAVRERWAAVRIGQADGDRAAAEAGVKSAYSVAGLAPPSEIVWCGGPVELARAWEDARSNLAIGANVRVAVVESVRERTSASVLPCLSAHVSALIRDAVRSPIADTAGAAVVDIVGQRSRDLRPPLRTRLLGAWQHLTRMRRPLGRGLGFARAGISPHELGWLAPYEFVCNSFGLQREANLLEGLRLVAANTGWMLPHEHVCWLSARHSILGIDARGRLHSATGPALAYRDGWSLHAWKGVEIRKEAIERPETVTVARINMEPNSVVRRCLIEIMTPQRFIAAGGAERIEQDEAGVLWRKAWWAGDAWAAVEVVDGTPGPDGYRKHYFLQVPPEVHSARAAVAWSYGVSEQQYAKLALRT